VRDELCLLVLVCASARACVGGCRLRSISVLHQPMHCVSLLNVLPVVVCVRAIVRACVRACVNCCLIEIAFQNSWHPPKFNVLLHNCSIQFAASTAATADCKPFNTARAVILLISNDST